MGDIKELFDVLDKCIVLYTNMFNFEHNKYAVIADKDIIQLEDMLKLEQSFVMRSAALEKQRISVQDKLGYNGLTLIEVAGKFTGEINEKLLNYREKLLELLTGIKDINKKSMQLVEVRLRSTEKQLEKSGYIQDIHTYDSDGTMSPSTAAINKSLVTKTI